MFNQFNIQCENSAGSAYYSQPYHPSFDANNNCEGYIGSGRYNCTALPIRDVKRICNCLSEGMLILKLFSVLYEYI